MWNKLTSMKSVKNESKSKCWYPPSFSLYLIRRTTSSANPSPLTSLSPISVHKTLFKFRFFPFKTATYTMHSCASSFTKSTPHLRFLAATTLNSPSSSVFARSSSSLQGSSPKGDRGYYENGTKNGHSSFLDSLLRSFSYGVLLLGPSLGLCYCSSSCSRDSFVSYADSGSQRREPGKKARFFFKGMFICYCSMYS